jgi:hypothetical protein
VQKTVKPPELFLDRRRQRFELGSAGFLEIERHNRGALATPRQNAVVYGFQSFDIAAVQDDRGAMRCARLGNPSADSIAGPRHQNDPLIEQCFGGGIVAMVGHARTS